VFNLPAIVRRRHIRDATKRQPNSTQKPHPQPTSLSKSLSKPPRACRCPKEPITRLVLALRNPALILPQIFVPWGLTERTFRDQHFSFVRADSSPVQNLLPFVETISALYSRYSGGAPVDCRTWYTLYVVHPADSGALDLLIQSLQPL